MHSAIHDHRAEILRLAREHGANNRRLFGSAARGGEWPDGDLDLLVDMEEGASGL